MNRRKFLQISAAAGAAAAAPALAMVPETEVLTNPTEISLGQWGGTYDVEITWDVIASNRHGSSVVRATATAVEFDPENPQSNWALLKFENGKAKIEKMEIQDADF